MIKYLKNSFIPALRVYLCNALVMNIPFYSIRRWYLRDVLGIKIGDNTYIGMGCFIVGNLIEIGSNTVINRGTYLDGRVPLKIGNNISISNYCYIQTNSHDPQSPDFHGVWEPVVIEDNVWVGAKALILTGVTLGEGCVIGAGAVVTKSIPAYTIAVGCPAKVIKSRNKNLTYKIKFFPIFDSDIQ